jgi:predicted RNase H-like HicB family nuclease
MIMIMTQYIQAALGRARYEKLEDDEGWFAAIDLFPGLWASASTVEATRTELASALEGWIILGLRQGEKVPPLDNIDLTPELASSPAS